MQPPSFSVQDISARLGGLAGFRRVLGLTVRILGRSSDTVAARVGSPFGSEIFAVSVRFDLVGRCTCGAAGQQMFCDHVAAAALEWLLDRGGPGLGPSERMPWAEPT